ncbi:MAG: hypothetical protein GQ564_23360 [Bacteroidales bacterium]|nr:hypothetical protein [Bacteroidales bacterium]
MYEGFKKWKNIKSDIFKIDTVENSISFNNLNESDTSKTSEYIVENITCNENEEIIDVEILQLERNKEVKDNTKITDTVYTFSLIVFPPLSKVFIDSVYQGNSDLDLKLKKGKYFVFAKKKGFIEHCEIIHIPTQRLLTIELKKDE